MPKALVVDDHFFIRSAVKTMLGQEHFQIVGEADNGADAIQLSREHAPDLIILDISMPKLDGLEVIGRIQGLGLNTRILVLTSQPAALSATRCMKASAAGYVSKFDWRRPVDEPVSISQSRHSPREKLGASVTPKAGER